ncbi:DUF3808 domain-containing protein [Pontibacter anaerobius]|uniref:DUF3808 domain-containing protein n=1 Tax=Pontibacter anaerobius TaxID=2993940 RepID=A0ABT3RDA0_9BACT|nr:DUF3808 domain-containing protein [Pontibacter anaerobius]MCX2739255.1 DUF3808 domain-containing protein [Pontibacter anaerobius]
MWLSFWLLPLTVATAAAFTPQHKTAYQELLQLKVNNGRNLLERLPQHDANTLLLANYADFLELCVQQDQNKYDDLLDAQEARLEKLENLTPQNEWADYAIAEVRLQIAMSKLLFGNRLSASWDFREAYLQYTQNLKNYPDFIPNKKNLGVLQVLIGSVPDKYKWFLNIIGLKGSIKAGMANLKVATAKANPFHQEAQLLYAVILHLTEPDKEEQALRQVKTMAAREQDNLLFQFVAMHLLKKTRSSDEALQVYLRRPQRSSYLAFPYLHHMAADLYLFRADYEKSIQENKQFLKMHPGQHYLKSANYKLYLAYALSNHKQQAQWHLQQVAAAGLEESEEDRYAARYAQKQEPLVKPLMQARLHSDGGYFREALQELDQLQITNATPVAVQAEYYYRKARIFHGTHSLQEALPLYQKAIALSQTTDLYFAPSASLQLGYIFQELKQTEKAKTYFKQALSYKHHEYKNSIDAKAKLALSAM